MKNLDSHLTSLIKLSKKQKKKTFFFIGNTAKPEKNDFFLTPIKENDRSIFTGAIVFNDKVAKNIAKKVDGKVDFIIVDLEKKIFKKRKFKKSLVNIEHDVKKIIKKSHLRVYKGNDLTVSGLESFINFFFTKDIRGVGGKKVLLVGSGNIGFKVALKLVESGADVSLFRRNQIKLNHVVKCINLIKPKATFAKAKLLKKIPDDFSKYDIIITAAKNLGIIKNKHLYRISNRHLLIDIGKGNFSQEALNYLIQKENVIFRLDITSAYFAYIDSIVFSEEYYKSKTFRKKIGDYTIVKSGVLGSEGEIVVDDVAQPKKIFGICDGKGDLKNIKLSNSHINKILKKFK